MTYRQPRQRHDRMTGKRGPDSPGGDSLLEFLSEAEVPATPPTEPIGAVSSEVSSSRHRSEAGGLSSSEAEPAAGRGATGSGRYSLSLRTLVLLALATAGGWFGFLLAVDALERSARQQPVSTPAVASAVEPAPVQPDAATRRDGATPLATPPDPVPSLTPPEPTSVRTRTPLLSNELPIARRPGEGQTAGSVAQPRALTPSRPSQAGPAAGASPRAAAAASAATLARTVESRSAEPPPPAGTPNPVTSSAMSPGAPSGSIVSRAEPVDQRTEVPSPSVPRGAVDTGASPSAAPVAAPPVAAAASAVDSVLSRYAAAYSQLDVAEAKAVWPGVNERALARAFAGVAQQQFDLGTCRVEITPPRALAACDGSVWYVPKVGSRAPRTEPRQWTFRLRQQNDNWAIESVDFR